MWKDICPNQGHVLLIKDGYDNLLMPTLCKSWECKTCSSALQNRVKDRITYGCSMAEYSWLITVTFKMGYGLVRNADYVNTAWTALSRLLKRDHPQMAWLRIVESTKRGQPHIHSIISLARNRVSDCHGKDITGKCNHRFDKAWLNEDCKANCLEHEVARRWFDVTGDSWVVDCRFVLGAKGAASYLAKYLTKASSEYRYLKSLGFHRRWTCSRNWPRQIMSGLECEEWRAVIRMGGGKHGGYGADKNAEMVKEGEKHPLIKRKNEEYYQMKRLEAMKYAIKRSTNEIIRSATIAIPSSGGNRQGGIGISAADWRKTQQRAS